MRTFSPIQKGTEKVILSPIQKENGEISCNLPRKAMILSPIKGGGKWGNDLITYPGGNWGNDFVTHPGRKWRNYLVAYPLRKGVNCYLPRREVKK